MANAKQKIISLLAVIFMVVAFFACTQQTAYAELQENTTPDNEGLNIAGYIETYGEDIQYFKDAADILYICDNFKNKSCLSIYLFQDVEFDNLTLDIPKNTVYNIYLENHSITSSQHSNDNYIFNVHGILNLNGGTGENRGKIEHTNKVSSMYVNSSGSITVNFVDFVYKGNLYTEAGSAVRFDENMNNQIFNNCRFTGKGSQGGAIAIFGNVDNRKEIKFTNCEFYDCTSELCGGAVSCFAKNIDLKFDKCIIDDCKSEHIGGAITLLKLGIAFYMNNCTIKECSAGNCGGAIYSHNDYVNYHIDNTEIDSCYAREDGGFLCLKNYQTESLGTTDHGFNNVHINNCKSKGDGGAFYLDSKETSFGFNNVLIENCESYGQGGAIYSNLDWKSGCVYLPINFNNSKIINCKAREEGGAIAAIGDCATYNFNKSLIDKCSAGNDGGAIYVKGSNVNLYGTGYIKTEDSSNIESKLINSSTISNCHSNSRGGAIYTSAAQDCGNDVEISHLSFINNSSDDDGGAVNTHGKTNLIIRCLFKYNKSKCCGGALYGYGNCFWYQLWETQVKECEFFNNKSDNDAKTVYLAYWKPENVAGNKIFYKNSIDPKVEFDTDDWKDRFTTIKIG